MAAVEPFGVALTRFSASLTSRLGQIQQQTKREVFQSIVHGSTITGAPGQPVDTGFLKKSWKWKEVGGGRSVLSSDCAYAMVIEYNDKAFWREDGEKRPEDLPHRDGGTQWVKSVVGGNGSVAKTASGWPAIVAFANVSGSRQRLSLLGDADKSDE